MPEAKEALELIGVIPPDTGPGAPPRLIVTLQSGVCIGPLSASVTARRA